jgi:glycosyltransferase involved in cell wall biosynthesis
MVAVGVLIDLRLDPESGGHVKCWERFAEAAVACDAELDLTLHFLGDQEREIELAPHVRYVLHKPRFSTELLPFFNDPIYETDMAGINPKLWPYLRQYDVIHTTHQLFTFGKTARKFCQRHQKPLVSSIHTDVPKYTEIYAAQGIQRVFGQGKISQLLLERWHFNQWMRRYMERRLQAYWPHCQHIFVSQQRDYRNVANVVPTARISYVRRGINQALFHPHQRDRQKLAQTYGIATDIPLLLFVGRPQACKNVMTFAHTVRQLLDQGIPVHALLVGEGDDRQQVQQLLQSHATFTGFLPPPTLAWVYASADLFVFPSENDVYGNVVVEAKASGLPIVVSPQSGSVAWLQGDGLDGYAVPSNDPAQWATLLARLLANPPQLERMGQAARQHIERAWPSWQGVLGEDLVPIWQRVARAKG